MEEQLISFKTAKLAKEKGFNEECTNYVCSNGRYGGDYNAAYRNSYGYLTAPTQSLLQKWLRKKYNIHVEMSLGTKDLKYDVALYYIEPEATWIKSVFRNLNSYEIALEKGLQEALKLIKI